LIIAAKKQKIHVKRTQYVDLSIGAEIRKFALILKIDVKK